MDEIKEIDGRMKKFFKEFKAFITRGNVIDMAVGVSVGGAFTAIVTALTTHVFQPLVNWALTGAGGGLESAVTMLKAVEVDGVIDMSQSIYIDWGAVISAVLNFLIIALILFSIVKAINKLHEVSAPKYYGYDKKEYYAMRRAGKSEEEIEKLAAARDKAKAEADAAAAEEAKKHTVEYLLEEIKTLLEKQSEK